MKLWLATAACLLVLSARASASGEVALNPRGLGSIRLGMTVHQLAASLGERLDEPSKPEDRSCLYVESAKHAGVRFMVEDGRLRRIDVSSPHVAAPGGIHVGDSEQVVKQKFGKRVVLEPHHYGGPEDHYLTIRLSRASAVRFETSDGKVGMFYLGGPKQVQYVEGCL